MLMTAVSRRNYWTDCKKKSLYVRYNLDIFYAE